MSKLSVEKFNKYIAEHKFILSGVYTLKKNIRFFEMKTPNTRKTFFVFVPENFILTEERLVELPTKFDMRRKDYTLSENFIKYINSTLTDDFDLVTISSTMLCHIPTMDVKDTTTYSFNLGDETYETDSDSDGASSKSSRSSSSSSMSSVKKHTSHIEQLIKESGLPDSAFNDSDDEPKKNDSEPTPVEETKLETPRKRDGDDDDALTIISDTPKQETEKSDEDDEDETSSSSSSSIDSIHSMEIDFDAPSRPEKKGVDKDEVDQIKKTKIVTDIPNDIEEQQIRLGLVYYCCNISYFVSKISMIEVEVEKCWKLSDDIRKNTWTNSIEQIKTKVSKLSDTLTTNINTNIEKYFLTQKNMSKLSVLYIKSFDDTASSPSPEKLQFQERTRQALDDVNITLVHIRNSIENEFEKVNALIHEITGSANP